MDQPEGVFFAELLHHFRKRARLTQQALAERIGAHRSTVSFWERGEYVPETLTMVLELARALQLTARETRLLIEARFGTASILPFHNLPEQNPYFTGRDALLQTLHTALTAGEQVALVQAQAISGLGGIGKTQAALAYAYGYREHYHDILWALADSREALTASYLALAQQLLLDLRAEHEQRKVVEAVKRWLREHKGWLLILDNIEDLGLVREFVPTPRQGAVVLTTRRTETSPLARALALDVLPEEEGILFLLRRTGQLPLEATGEAAALYHRATAKAIVQALGGLPLALDQAGAYIAETRCRLSDYLALFQQERRALLQRRGAVPTEHPQSVTTTFALAFAQVQHQSEAALELLRLCAFLAPEAIPLDLLTQGTAELGPMLAPVTAQALAFNAALETLQAYSLVRRDAEQRTLALHRLVQAVQQEALSEPLQRLWAERAVRLVSAAFPSPDVATWERCQQLVPHALACAEHIEHWSFAFPEAASLLHQTGRYLYQRAAYEQALPLLQQALALREQVLGSEHPLVAESLDILAELSREQGQYAEALPLYQRALAIREQVLEPTHSDVAESLNNLALLYCAQGQNEQALPLYQRARALWEQTLGAHHPLVATSLNNLAELYRTQGQYKQALSLYQQALTIRVQALGPGHPDVAQSMNNLALLYYMQGQYAEALPLYQRALAIREQALGPDHPEVAYCLNNLALLYYAQGQYEPALPLYQRVLTIFEQALGPDHPTVATSLNNLALLYRVQRRFVEALPLFQRALAIDEQALGRDHPDVAIDLHNLALLYSAQGQYEQALPLFQRALASFEQVLGSDHPSVAQSLNGMAELSRAQGRFAEALPLYRRALAIREQALGPDHPNVAESLNNLALLYYAQEQYEQALPLFQRALTILEQALPDHPNTATSLERLTALLRRMGQAEEASTLEARMQALHVRRTQST